MDIVRNADGTLLVPVAPERRHTVDDSAETSPDAVKGEVKGDEAPPATPSTHSTPISRMIVAVAKSITVCRRCGYEISLRQSM